MAKLLSGSPEPQVLIEQILQALGPEKLQSLLGTILSGAPVVQSTVEQLAGQLGTSPQALAEQFGKSAEHCPARRWRSSRRSPTAKNWASSAAPPG